MKKETENNYPIGTIEKTFAVLEYIESHVTDVSAIEIYSQLDIPKATLHKILQNLVNLGYIGQNPETSHYYPTMKMLQIAHNSINRHKFFETYYPYVMMYLRRYNCPSSLAAFSGLDPVVVYSSIAKADIIVDNKRIIGYTLPLHASSSGRLLLSTLPEDVARQALARNPLTPYTGATLCRIDEVIDSLQSIREKGYCMLVGEVYFGFTNFSFPLYDVTHTMVGSYNLVIPSDSVGDKISMKEIEEIRDTLAAIKLPNI